MEQWRQQQRRRRRPPFLFRSGKCICMHYLEICFCYLIRSSLVARPPSLIFHVCRRSNPSLMSAKKQQGSVRELRMCDVYNLSLGYSLRPVLLLDIRSSDDYNSGHCFGAASVPINTKALDAALEAGMSTVESCGLEIFSLINAHLLRPPEHLGGMFDGVFNRKLVHHERFLDREHSIVCVYGSVPCQLPSASALTATQIPITKRVADAIAANSSSEFTCFYMTDAFSAFTQEYPHAVQTDTWRHTPDDGTRLPSSESPETTAASENLSTEATGLQEEAADDSALACAGVAGAEQHPAAQEFNLKGCPPM